MSPKKRRTASSSRKGPTRRRSTPEAAALREARQLLDETRLTAENWASLHLGATWADAPLGQRHPEEQAVLELVDEARRRPSPAAAAALAAARLVVPHPEIDRALQDLGQPLPAWADEPAPQPVTAWRASDPWRSQEVWFVDYGDHLLVARVAHPGGTTVQELALTERSSLRSYDDFARGDDARGRRTEVPVEQALRALRDALRWTELAWPRATDDSYEEYRLAALARLGTLAADEEPDQGREQERERLRQEFLGDETGEAEQYATELFLDYSYGHLHLPLYWSPDDVALFLLDWVPRRVSLDEHEQAVLPDLLERWVRFALTEVGVEPRWHEPVAEAVRLAATDFPGAYASAGNLPTR